MCLSISWDCLRALGSECVLYFSEKRREGEWISFSPRSLGGGTVHVNLSHSVNVFSSSPPPSLHTLSGVFLGFGKFFVCVCCFLFFGFFFLLLQIEISKKKSMIKNVFALYLVAEESSICGREKKGRAREKSSPLRWWHCLICDCLEGGGVTDISHPVYMYVWGLYSFLWFASLLLDQVLGGEGETGSTSFFAQWTNYYQRNKKPNKQKTPQQQQQQQHTNPRAWNKPASERESCALRLFDLGESLRGGEWLNLPSHRRRLLGSPPRRRRRRRRSD